MKIQLFVMGLLLTGASGFAGTCVPGTLQDYIDLDPTAGCTAGAVTFRSFGTLPGQVGATLIDPATISVTPGGTFLQPNLQFGVNMTAATGQFLESIFGFEVFAPIVGRPFIALGPGSSAFGDGAALATAEICPGAGFIVDFCVDPTTALIALKTADVSVPFDSARFLRGSLFGVNVDLTIDGALSGQATMDSAQFGVTAVPEPTTMAFAAAGLAALALRRRRTRH